MKIKNKKSIIMVSILIVGVIGLTIAYFTNVINLDNIFTTKSFGTTYTEEFTSPDNWLPGDTTSKTIVVTNSGSVDEAVRISYTEVWKSNNGNILSGFIDENGKLTYEEENSDKAAIINFSNNYDWVYNDGYYYYNFKLAPNESTSSLIESVTFNPDVTLGDTCQETESNGKKTITCNSSGDDYDNASYTLTFTIETVQYDKYKNAWHTDINILNNRNEIVFCDQYQLITYNGDEYFVLQNSDFSKDYVSVLKKDSLTAEEVNNYGSNYISLDGEYPYYESETCNENVQTGCSSVYETSNIKTIIDGWASSFSDDLVSVDGYKVRLFNANDNIYNVYETPSSVSYSLSGDTPNFIKSDQYYWTSFSVSDSDTQVYVIGKYNSMPNFNIYDKYYIRPVMNLKKSVIKNQCSSSITNYSVGTKLVCGNNDFYVIDDNKDIGYVKLLKSDVLTADEINSFNTDYLSEDGEYPYFESDTCNYDNKSGCSQKNDYNNSSVKIVVDKWAEQYEDDLLNIDGNKTSLITEKILKNNLGYSNTFVATSDTPLWVYDINKYWSMSGYSYGPNYTNVYRVSWQMSNPINVYDKSYIRPVINVKKDAVDNKCTIIGDTGYDYHIGDSLSYNNEEYCVINNSKSTQDYVSLLKKEPFSYNELINYNTEYDIQVAQYSGNACYYYTDSDKDVSGCTGSMSYYKSDTCYYNSDSDKNVSGCKYNYEDSFVKNIIDNWSASFSNDLKQVDGYKTRLLLYDEMPILGFSRVNTGTTSGFDYYLYEGPADSCFNTDYSYWVMGAYKVGRPSHSGISDTKASPYQYFTVRPVINLKKCAITNTCE